MNRVNKSYSRNAMRNIIVIYLGFATTLVLKVSSSAGSMTSISAMFIDSCDNLDRENTDKDCFDSADFCNDSDSNTGNIEFQYGTNLFE